MTHIPENVKLIADKFCEKMENDGHITFDNYWVVYEAVLHGYTQAIKSFVDVNKSDSIYVIPDLKFVTGDK